MAGAAPAQDVVGRKVLAGGRTEAKDLYDVYFLSSTFMPLSRFMDKYTNDVIKEGLIAWFRTYDRMKMMDGFMALQTKRKVDCKRIEKHFNKIA